MSLFDVTPQFLQQRLPGLALNYASCVEKLNLDPAHLQLLNDCFQQWRQYDLPDQFWLYLLLLVDEINRGSSCLNLSSSRFKSLQQHFKLSDWQDLNVSLQQLNLAQQPVIIFQPPYLFFQKYHRAEQNLQQQIKSLIHHYQGHVYQPSEIQDMVKPIFSTLRYPLNQEQIQAVFTALLQPFSLVSGGPGTGKTTMVATVLRCLHALGVEIKDMALAAPTGRAAYRMTESLQFGFNEGLMHTSDGQQTDLMTLEAQTIHRLIGKSHRFNQRNRYHAEHRLPFKVIVIDEVSMVDLQLMTELLAAVDIDCRLILVGDQFQLPSVESGAVLADLMPPQSHRLILSHDFAHILSQLMAPYVESPVSFKAQQNNDEPTLLMDTCTVLTQSHRSTKAIQNVSECVRVGDADGFLNHSSLIKVPHTQIIESAGKEGVFLVPPVNDGTVGLAVIWNWFKHHIQLDQYHKKLQSCLRFEARDIDSQRENLEAIFKHINQQQILTLVNQGFSGQEIINRYLSQQIKQLWQIEAGQDHFHGQVVMMRRNDYDKQLFNGDVGVILQADDGWQAVFPGQSGYRSYALALLPHLSTAFAITVHKSQGSEYNHVLMPLPNDINNRLLSREIIYTGMTRAKSSVLIYGSEAVLRKAIENHSQRQSGLQFW